MSIDSYLIQKDDENAPYVSVETSENAPYECIETSEEPKERPERARMEE